MLTAKENGKSVDLTYTAGDTFKFGISTEKLLDEGTVVRLQVSLLGSEYEFVIDKTISFVEQPMVISLTTNEAKRLKEGKIYNYRITFIDANSQIITRISGDIEVKWGV